MLTSEKNNNSALVRIIPTQEQAQAVQPNNSTAAVCEARRMLLGMLLRLLARKSESALLYSDKSDNVSLVKKSSNVSLLQTAKDNNKTPEQQTQVLCQFGSGVDFILLK